MGEELYVGPQESPKNSTATVLADVYLRCSRGGGRGRGKGEGGCREGKKWQIPYYGTLLRLPRYIKFHSSEKMLHDIYQAFLKS